MEPVSIFGLVVNIVQIIDFSAKLVREAYELHQSNSGLKAEYVELHRISESLSRMCEGVPSAPFDQSALRFESMGHEVFELARCTKQVAEDLMAATEKLKLTEGPHRRWRSFRQALATVWNKDEIEKLNRRLGQLRSQLQANMMSHIL